MAKKTMTKVPEMLKDYLPTREAYQFAVDKGLDHSLAWFKAMVWKNRIPSINLGGRKWIHKDELKRVVKERPKLHLIDLVTSKVA